VERVRGDSDVEGIVLELLVRPGEVGREDDDAEGRLLLALRTHELQGLVGGHAVQDVVEARILVLLGLLDFLQEVLVVDRLDELVKVDQQNVLVGHQRLGEAGLTRARGQADDILADAGGIADAAKAAYTQVIRNRQKRRTGTYSGRCSKGFHILYCQRDFLKFLTRNHKK